MAWHFEDLKFGILDRKTKVFFCIFPFLLGEPFAIYAEVPIFRAKRKNSPKLEARGAVFRGGRLRAISSRGRRGTNSPRSAYV
jgi:hypothetical protein